MKLHMMLTTLALLCAVVPDANGAAPVASVEQLEAAVPMNPLKDAYFGETHLHTAYSLDAYISGATLTPDGAYRFASGEEKEVAGQRLRLRRPLDWAAVTDHAEYLGEMYSTLTPGAPGHDQPLVQELLRLETPEQREHWFLDVLQKNARSAGKRKHTPLFAGIETERSGWRVAVEAAAAHYRPGRFTTFAAFEWSAAPAGANLHRNLLFRDLNVPDKVMSAIDIPREHGLWGWMDGLEDQGMRVLAIPHNSNASKGAMFDPLDPEGRPIDLAYARERSRREPVIEMLQVKGNSEVHRSFWPADEFAGFENADSIQAYSDRTFVKRNFVREGVIRGLEHHRALGANPYRYGFVGGTDLHNGTAGNTAEDNFLAGSHGAADATVELRRSGVVPSWLEARQMSPGALTGAWADSNTRGAIWDAMARRETFATSGTRIKVRFFGGWDYPTDLARRKDRIARAYAGGVPMGGELTQVRAGKAPRFLVVATKDPDGANLDRIQVIKGWTDGAGATHEQIYDVAWSGRRRPGRDGVLPSVGSTVDLKTATYANTVGAAELAATWTDPAFDARQHALYYVRVLEIPTPRWTTYDAVRAGLPLLEDVPATLQERAWSSPIWYSPQAAR